MSLIKRRAFLGGLLAVAAEPIVEVSRTYSFIWTPPEPTIVRAWPQPDMAKLLFGAPWLAVTGLAYIIARGAAQVE